MTTVRASEKLANAARLGAAWLRRPQALPEKWLASAGLYAPRDLRLPDFLGIGAQKAGTTWLHRNLQCHPDCYFPPGIKEIRFFDARFYWSLRKYSSFFEPAGERVTGEITPGYGALRRGRIRFVRRLMPRVRLVLILRNPIERAWSHAVMDLATTRGRRLEEVEEWEFLAHFRSSGARRQGSYAAMLERWLSVFPEEQLLVAFFEDIAERPRDLLSRVFRHIGVSEPADWERFPYDSQIHGGLPAALPDAYRESLREIYRGELEALAARLGGPARGWR